MTVFLEARALRTCALEGCDKAVVSPGHGGRPRMYCSDAHRAQARRRRLRTGRAGEQGPIPAALGQLRQAVTLLEGVVATSTDRTAEEAEARARATAQVLEAQRMAADAAAQLAESRRELERTRQALEGVRRERAVERSQWDAARRASDDRHQRDQATIRELEAALEGARAELEDELLAHHRDVAQLEAELGRVGGRATGNG